MVYFKVMLIYKINNLCMSTTFLWQLLTNLSTLRTLSSKALLNTLRTRQNGRHFADHIVIYICVNENVWIAIDISIKFVPKDQINNIPAVVQITAWRRPSDQPLSEPMMLSLLTHICVTRPQWVNTFEFGGAFISMKWVIIGPGDDLLHVL